MEPTQNVRWLTRLKSKHVSITNTHFGFIQLQLETVVTLCKTIPLLKYTTPELVVVHAINVSQHKPHN